MFVGLSLCREATPTLLLYPTYGFSQRLVRAFSELRCSFGGRSTIPDVTVFTNDRIPRDENGDIANVFAISPDWTIEILSPDQSQTKVTKNILHCLQHGMQMGWLIDPAERSVFVYSSDRLKYLMKKLRYYLYLTLPKMFRLH